MLLKKETTPAKAQHDNVVKHLTNQLVLIKY